MDPVSSLRTASVPTVMHRATRETCGKKSWPSQSTMVSGCTECSPPRHSAVMKASQPCWPGTSPNGRRSANRRGPLDLRLLLADRRSERRLPASVKRQRHRQPLSPPVSGVGLEDAGTDCAAPRAPIASFEVPAGQLVPVSTDQHGAASVAKGAVGLGIMNVAHVSARTPFLLAINWARRKDSGGVGGRSSRRKSGWNAEKCNGTSGPRFSTTQRVMSSSSRSESLRPEMSKVWN